jgi:hypothetical protein
VETGAPYELFRIRYSALRTGKTFMILPDLHNAFKDMLAGAAFKFIEWHGTFLFHSYGGKLAYLSIRVKGDFGMKNPGGIIPPGLFVVLMVLITTGLEDER